jgi:hypothetical protein
MPTTFDTRLIDLRPDLPRHQSAKAAPVVVNRDLPTMAAPRSIRAEPKKAGQILMDMGAKRPAGGKERMAKVPKNTSGKQPNERKPQQPYRRTAQAALDGYVRLELHRENGRLSVVGVHEVAGPLTIPDAIIHGHVYEVLVGDRRIGLGSIPDAGGRHSFANADVPGPEGKHHFIAEPAFDFFVRVPKAELTQAALPHLQVVLYRITAAPDRLSAQPLAKHPGVEAVAIAHLPGIETAALPPNVRRHLERLLRNSESQ